VAARKRRVEVKDFGFGYGLLAYGISVECFAEDRMRYKKWHAGACKFATVNNDTDDRYPYYSPSGKRIAYTNFVTGGDEEIYTINPNGGSRLNVTDNSTDDDNPSYSPSGKKIAYVNHPTTDSEIWTIKPEGGGRLQVTDNANNDNWPYWGSQ
jgi:dipeptidyl aminopeptidase/acylaminoacyl peptidase